MNITLKINGTTYTDNLHYPIQMTELIDGGQDSGGFVLLMDTKKPFAQFSKVEITIDGTKHYWYCHDKVTQAVSSAKYKHTITLVERVRILEGYYLSNLSFTQPLQRELAEVGEIYTYKTAIERVLRITPLAPFPAQPFVLDSEIATPLNKIEFPETFPTSTNLYEFMLNVGMSIGAVPYMKDWDTISFWTLENTESMLTEPPEYANYYSERNIDQFCTNIDVTLNNIVGEGKPIVEPAPSGWIYPKNSTATKYVDGDTNASLELNYPIHKLHKVIMYGTLGVNGITQYPTVDITHRILEKSKYDILPDKEKAYYLWYNYNDNKIGGFYYTFDTIFGIDSKYAVCYVFSKAFRENNYPITTEDPVSLNEDSKYYLFRVEYYPLTEVMRIKVERTNDNDFRTEFSFAANQTSNIVSAKQAGAMYQKHIERIGKEARKYVSEINGGMASVPVLGSYFIEDNERYYLYKYNLLIASKDKITLEHFWSKDYSQISEHIGLNSAPRFSEIPYNTINRAEVLKEHCIISDTQIGSNAYFFSTYDTYTNGMRSAVWGDLIFELVQNGKKQCNFAYVWTIDKNYNTIQNALKPLLLPVNATAVGNSLLFSVAFKDNYSAGTQIKNVPDTSNQAYYDVRYTEINLLGGSFGRMSKMTLSYISDTALVDSVAQAKLLPEVQASNASELDANRLWKVDQINIEKDGSEVLHFAHQISFEGENGFIVGESFVNRNPLIDEDTRSFVEITTDKQVAYNGTEWVQSASGTYLQYNGAVVKISNDKRYNRVGNGWMQDNSGTHLLVAKELRLVALDKELKPDGIGKVEYYSILPYPINIYPTAIGTQYPHWRINDMTEPYPLSAWIKAWAIVDEYDRLVIGKNNNILTPIYFNFRRTKDYANQI